MTALARYWQAVAHLGPMAWRFLLFTTFSSISFSMYNLNFNLYLYALGFKQDFIGFLNGLPSLAILVLGLPIGLWADRFGYLRFLVAGAILNALAAFGLAVSSSALLLLSFSLLSGVAGAMSWVVGAPFLMSISRPEDRVYLFAVNSAIMLGTGFLGSLLAGAVPEVLAAHWGSVSTGIWPLRGALLVNFFFAFLGTVALLGLKNTGAVAKPSPAVPKTANPLPRTWAELLLFLRLLAPQALVALGAGAMVSFFQLFFNLRFGLEPGKIGPIFAFSSVATMVATLIAPLLANRLGKVRTIVLTELLSIPFLLVLAYSHHLPVVIMAFYFRGALMNMAGPVQQTFILEQVEEGQRATLTSLGAMLGGLGRGGLGPIISGYLQVISGFSLAFTFTTACYIVGALLFWYLFRHNDDGPSVGATSLREAEKVSSRVAGENIPLSGGPP